MKKILGLFLGLCFMFLPFAVKAAEKIDVTKYNTLNFKETLEEEEIELKYTDYKETDKQATIYLFRGKGCGYCRAFLTFLNENAEELGKYFKVVSFETWYDENNGQLLTDVSTFLGQPAQGVPFIIIGDQVFPGYAESYNDGIKSAIKDLYDSEDRYDVFEAYNDAIDAEEKAANASTNKIIIWNFVFVFVATVVLVLVIKSAENSIIGELRDGRHTKADKKYKEVVHLDADDEETDEEERPRPKKPSNKKKNVKRK